MGGEAGGEGKAVWGGEGRAEALPSFESSSTLMVFIVYKVLSTQYCAVNIYYIPTKGQALHTEQ